MKEDDTVYETEDLGVRNIWHRTNRHEKLIHLRHSCDCWIIGKPNDAKKLIEDLQHIIDNWKSYSITGLKVEGEED